jgi:hypothetical protein
MAEQYGVSGIPGDSTTVRSGGTVAVSTAFNATLGLVGGMDTDNGSATAGDVVTIESSTDAATQFGESSELKEQVDLALAQQSPPSEIYAVGVTETETTESVSGSQTGTLSNNPFDPNVHPDEEITVQDTVEGQSVTVNIDYRTGTDLTSNPPTETNTININPNTGEYAADESSDYDFTYSYGDYQGAIADVAKKVPRALGVCTERVSVGNDVLAEVNNYDVNFDFMHAYIGAPPESDASNYSDSFDDRRLSVIAPARGYTDTAETNMQRSVGAVAGKQAGKPLGDSTTYEGLGGFASLNTEYTNSEIATLIDSQVYPLRQSGGIKVIKDMTTSTDSRFERVYASEIIDEATEVSHRISEDFIGEANIQEQRGDLAESHRISYREFVEDDLLTGFAVTPSLAGDDAVDLDIGIEVVGIIDRINVTISVGDVVTNGGVA